MKKWLALTAALLSFACCLTGCGNDNGNADSNSAAESSTSTEATTVTEAQTTEGSTGNSTNDGVIGDIMTDAEDMVGDIVTDAGDIVNDIIPTDSTGNGTDKTE